MSTIMTNFNERTNTLLYKDISLTLYSRKGWCWLCVRGELETGTDCYILSQVFLIIAALPLHLGCSTVGHWGPKALYLPLVLNSTSCLRLTRPASGTWLYNCLTFFRLFTPVHFLIDGLVEGQYVTIPQCS